MLTYKIAVCDDEELQLERIYNMVNENFEKLGCDFEISKFINPKKTIDNKEFKCRDSINKKEKELEDHGFVRTHYGYDYRKYLLKNTLKLVYDKYKKDKEFKEEIALSEAK
jgi:DNA-binding LytR/AlgR family response regulator